MAIVDSTEGSSTSTFWKRRSSAASFSTYLRYSSSVVAPTQCSSPRASAGFSMLPASIAPSALPAPTIVCSSSMKTIVWPSSAAMSFSTAFSRSSNSPRYLAPASSAAMSSDSTRLFFSVSGTSPLTMRCARPSTMAVLPTPGSPISTGLFLVRRCRIWIVRRISSSRPITGSSLPSRARAVRSIVYLSSASRWPSASWLSTPAPPRTASMAASSALRVRPASLAMRPVSPLSPVSASRNSSLAMNWSPRLVRFLVGQVEQVVEVARDGDLAALPLDLGQPLDRRLERRLQPGHGDPGARQQRRRAAVFLREQRGEQVLRLDEAVVVAQRQALRVGKRLLELGGQFVETHERPSVVRFCS